MQLESELVHLEFVNGLSSFLCFVLNLSGSLPSSLVLGLLSFSGSLVNSLLGLSGSFVFGLFGFSSSLVLGLSGSFAFSTFSLMVGFFTRARSGSRSVSLASLRAA